VVLDGRHTNLDTLTGAGDHCWATGHSVSMDNTKALTQQLIWHTRKVKAIYINQRAPTETRDTMYMYLPSIYNQIVLPKSEPNHLTPVQT